MDQKTKFQQVIDILQEKGYTDGQITELAAGLTKESFARLYTEAAATFTDEDINAIEATKTQEEANEEIKKRYTLRTGKNADEETQRYLDTFCQGFLAEYDKEKQAQQTTPAT